MRRFAMWLALVGFAPAAEAQVYKYVKSDGTIVYTDRLGDLPADRQRHYNQLERERQATRERLERELGKEELERREAEQKAEALRRQQANAAQNARELAEIQARIDLYKRRAEEREAQKAVWQTRLRLAKEKLADLLRKFREAQERYNGIALKPMHTLLPGEAEERENARKAVEALEPQIDRTIQEIEIDIPESARKAGVPPGWLR